MAETTLTLIRAVVAEQAEDDGLWFRAQTASEAYLQQELRRLHAVVEADLGSSADEGRMREAQPFRWSISRGDEGEFVEWTGGDGVLHRMPLWAAIKEVADLYDAWPGGLDEVESAIDGWRRKANAALTPSPAAPTSPGQADMSREAFEAWARERFVCGEHSFVRAHPYGYINTVHSDTFGGRVQTNYADVQMLWETWQASSRESEALLRRAVEALDESRDDVLNTINSYVPHPYNERRVKPLREQLARHDEVIAAIRQHLGEKT